MRRKEISASKLKGIWKVFFCLNLEIMLIAFLLAASLYSQESGQDSLNIRYEMTLSPEFHSNETIFRIKVPPFLSKNEVMEQIKLAVQWPGDPPPKKKTVVYVFKETDQIGLPSEKLPKSKTRAIYFPRKGYKWFLDGWTPSEIPLVEPTVRETLIYYTFLDSLYSSEGKIQSEEIRSKIARQFNISVPKLDSIYLKVKYWKLKE